MPRKINISKYQGNTQYSVHVIDNYGTEHHIGYLGITFLTFTEIEMLAEEIWAYEVEPKEDLLGNAIKECIEVDKKNGLRFTDSRGNHRDGLD